KTLANRIPSARGRGATCRRRPRGTPRASSQQRAALYQSRSSVDFSTSQIAEDAESSFELPTRIGRFQAVAVLGRGSGSSVLLAVETEPTSGSSPMLAVVKRPRASRARSAPEFLAMFHDEARIAARLHHPNIAHVLDVGHTGALPYIATEFLHGQALNVI